MGSEGFSPQTKLSNYSEYMPAWVLQEEDVEMKLESQEVPCKKCLKDKRGRKMIRKGKLSDLPFRSNICEMKSNGHKMSRQSFIRNRRNSGAKISDVEEK